VPDFFDNVPLTADAPATHAAPVTPNDSADLSGFTAPFAYARALYVGGAGDVVVDTAGGETAVKFSAVPAGMVLPVRCKRVRATNTTATLIVALW
jgi:hypothetical protein